MILKELDVSAFDQELEKDLADHMIGKDDEDRSDIAIAFNNGLKTMMYRASSMLWQKIGKQTADERQVSA